MVNQTKFAGFELKNIGKPLCYVHKKSQLGVHQSWFGRYKTPTFDSGHVTKKNKDKINNECILIAGNFWNDYMMHQQFNSKISKHEKSRLWSLYIRHNMFIHSGIHTQSIIDVIILRAKVTSASFHLFAIRMCV